MESLGSHRTLLNLAYNMHALIHMKANIRFLIRYCLLIIGFAAASAHVNAQKISYSEPEREDTRRTNFEIIGKVGSNILIFKNNRNNNDISVYDPNMKLLNRIRQTDLDDRWINVDFVPYPEFAWMIYQYQRKSVVYCMAVKIGPDGKRISEPIELDTTRIGWSASNKIYTTIFSDDKQQIMVFKINSRNPNRFAFTTLLFNNKLELRYKHRMQLDMEERNDYFTDFMLDNDGDMVFGKYIRRSGSDNITDIFLIQKKSNEEQFRLHDIKTGTRLLDEISVKVDNNNKRYLFNALYYRERRGNIEGLFTSTWDKKQDTLLRETELVFTEEMRKLAKGPDANLRMAFDDYYITSVITKKDGGYILISESMYTTSRGNAFNRWDRGYFNSPWASPLDYYYWSPYSYGYSPFYSPWNRFGGNNQTTRYFSENIMVLSFDADGKLAWHNTIPKQQFDDESDGMISHAVMITGGELHMLFNLYERRTLMLNDQSISPDGKITRYPTLKNLDREIDFMPRFGKQISSRSLIMPCMYRNSLTFAKLDF